MNRNEFIKRLTIAAAGIVTIPIVQSGCDKNADPAPGDHLPKADITKKYTQVRITLGHPSLNDSPSTGGDEEHVEIELIMAGGPPYFHYYQKVWSEMQGSDGPYRFNYRGTGLLFPDSEKRNYQYDGWLYDEEKELSGYTLIGTLSDEDVFDIIDNNGYITRYIPEKIGTSGALKTFAFIGKPEPAVPIDFAIDLAYETGETIKKTAFERFFG